MLLVINAFSGQVDGETLCFQELRETAIEMKHAKEISELMSDYKTMYSKWVFELR